MSVKVLMVDGVDRTDAVIFADAEFTSAVNGRAGTCHFRVKDANQTQFFTVGKEITLDVDGVRSWGGYAMQIKRGYWFDSYDCRCKVNITPRYWEVEGADYNILFERRILYDKVTPENGYLTAFPAGTFDSTVIDYYIANHLDLSGDGLGTSLVTHVGTPSTDTEIQAGAGWTWSTFMRWITSVTGAIYYIRPDKEVVHTDVETADSPFGISDDPTTGEVGCRDLEIDYNGSNLVNDALVWGAGQGSASPVFSRSTDAASITEHGRWQLGAPFQAIWKQETADSVSSTYVYGSPQSLRGGKDDQISARCAVYTAGLVCGQKVPLRSAVFGFTRTIPIRMMKITFPTKEDVKWDLTLSHEIDQPWTGFDAFPFPPLPPFPVLDINIPPLPSFDPCADSFQGNRPCPAETFSRGDGSGWGPSEIGDFLTWGGSISPDATVDGGQGFLKTSVNFSTPFQYIDTNMTLPVDITWDMHWSAVPSSPHVQPSLVYGGMSLTYIPPTGTVTGPSMWVSALEDGRVTFTFLANGGVQLLGGAGPLTTYIPNRVVSCKFRVTSGTLYGKIWYKGSGEPSDWQASFPSNNGDSSRLVAFGRNTTSDEPTDVYFDNIHICDSGGPLVTDTALSPSVGSQYYSGYYSGPVGSPTWTGDWSVLTGGRDSKTTGVGTNWPSGGTVRREFSSINKRPGATVARLSGRIQLSINSSDAGLTHSFEIHQGNWECANNIAGACPGATPPDFDHSAGLLTSGTIIAGTTPNDAIDFDVSWDISNRPAAQWIVKLTTNPANGPSVRSAEMIMDDPTTSGNFTLRQYVSYPNPCLDTCYEPVDPSFSESFAVPASDGWGGTWGVMDSPNFNGPHKINASVAGGTGYLTQDFDSGAYRGSAVYLEETFTPNQPHEVLTQLRFDEKGTVGDFSINLNWASAGAAATPLFYNGTHITWGSPPASNPGGEFLSTRSVGGGSYEITALDWQVGVTYNIRTRTTSSKTVTTIWVNGEDESTALSSTATGGSDFPASIGYRLVDQYAPPDGSLARTTLAFSAVQIRPNQVVPCLGTLPDPPVGYTCENLTRIATPAGGDPSLTYFQTANVYKAGTTKVWVDGLRLAWYDYDELPTQAMIAVHADVDVGGGDAFDPPKTLYACYLGG